MRKKIGVVLLVALTCLTVWGCGQSSSIDYSDDSMWAFNQVEGTKNADVFMVAPTVYFGDEDNLNMPIDDEESRDRIVGAINMQIGIYSEELNVFAPYYEQASFTSVEAGTYDECLDPAYEDVSAAFKYYMENKNNGRPFVLTGFSQGAEMCVRLMEEYPDYLDNMIACYIYGRALTDEEITEYPQMIPATGETDTGVVVCFNSEAPDINDTFTIPAGVKSICINPLNWKTDATPADKSLNKGACFTDYDAKIAEETPELTGAYIDESRGVLKLPDIDADKYQSSLSIFKKGEYHTFEYMFFYRNLQDNVKDRIDSWFAN